MIIYPQETDDGLAAKITASTSISYASIVEPCDITPNQKSKIKVSASVSDADLYYVQSILVSSSWNRNDDIFDRAEVWAARATPEDKPTNLEHDENTIIGHITSNWPIDLDGKTIADDIDMNDLPEKFHIVTGSVIYKAYSTPELKERAERLIAEIENGTKYVSMECYFKGFDYGLTNKITGEYKVLARNEDTAYLTKHLRAYGGSGEQDNYKLGRVLRNITFSGKGFVDKPANPDSIIFQRQLIDDLLDKKNDNLSNSGVVDNKPITSEDMENIIMSENIEKQVAEISDKLDTVAASCDQTEEAKTLASELQKTNQTLEAAMKEKEEMLEAKSEELETLAMKMDEEVKSKKELMAEMKNKEDKSKAELEEILASKAELEEALKAAQTSLEEANEVIAGYKMKEEEQAKKDMLMKRKANLVEAGLDDDAASAAVEKFESLDDDSFEAVLAAMTAVKPKKEEEKAKKEETEAAMPPALKEALEKKKKEEKEKASESDELEEAESALEEVEAEETVDLSVGSDESETESAEASVRAELVEFVSARLGNTSK
tara:strand:- start:1335 stop:2981 length:1647 start_codon:yes stop_codon:yes gene_type:complete